MRSGQLVEAAPFACRHREQVVVATRRLKNADNVDRSVPRCAVDDGRA